MNLIFILLVFLIFLYISFDVINKFFHNKCNIKLIILFRIIVPILRNGEVIIQDLLFSYFFNLWGGGGGGKKKKKKKTNDKSSILFNNTCSFSIDSLKVKSNCSKMLEIGLHFIISINNFNIFTK